MERHRVVYLGHTVNQALCRPAVAWVFLMCSAWSCDAACLPEFALPTKPAGGSAVHRMGTKLEVMW